MNEKLVLDAGALSLHFIDRPGIRKYLDTMGHSDIIRAIVLAYLSEKGYLDKGGKLPAKKEST